MILPTTYLSALLLMLFSMLCWGSWANTQKLTGKWRFELYYYDFALGVLLCAVITAFTFGTLNGAELSFQDNFLISAYRKMAWAVGAGFLFNLANMLLVAGISVAGLSVAFPIGIGLALIIGVVWNYALNPQGNPIFLFGGAALVLIAIVFDALAYSAHAAAKKQAELAAGPAPAAAAPAAPRMEQRTSRSGRTFSRSNTPTARTPSAIRGIVFCVVGGIMMGGFYPMVETAKTGDGAVGPYGTALLFAVGLFISTFIYNPFFMNFPIQGLPLGIGEFFRSTRRQHLLGLLGGTIWCAGAIANFVASSAPPQVSIGPAISYAVGQGATVISALWGLLVWKEFAGAVPRVKSFLAIMIVLFVAGLTLVAIAPLYPMLK